MADGGTLDLKALKLAVGADSGDVKARVCGLLTTRRVPSRPKAT
jgi:hypothetical protein